MTGATGLLAAAEANRPHRKKPPRNPPNQQSADAIAKVIAAVGRYGDEASEEPPGAFNAARRR